MTGATAYLLVWFATETRGLGQGETTVIRVRRMSIHSEPPWTITFPDGERKACALVYQCDGANYDEARATLVSAVRLDDWLAWTKPWLSVEDGGERS